MDWWDIVDQKNANDPRAVVIPPFGGTKPSFFCFNFLSVKQLIVPCVLNSSLCVLYLYLCTCAWS